MTKRIMGALPADIRPNVATITWGNHLATNDYADVPNVILAGTLFMRQSHYLALTHMASDHDVSLGFVDDGAVARTTSGEHANLCLQAVCRGRVRKSDGDKCQPMAAYIIASPRSGIADILSDIFPNCSLQPWKPFKPALKGKQAVALKVLATALNSGEFDWVSYRDVAGRMRMAWPNFRKIVSTHAAWADHLASAGMSEAIGPRGAKGVRLTRGIQLPIPLMEKVSSLQADGHPRSTA